LIRILIGFYRRPVPFIVSRFCIKEKYKTVFAARPRASVVVRW
jgi:hypothetical protein